jgi:hypothetical protein
MDRQKKLYLCLKLEYENILIMFFVSLFSGGIVVTNAIDPA